MKLIQSVNLMDNKKLIVMMNIASVPLMIFFFFLFMKIPTSRESNISLEFSIIPIIAYLIIVFSIFVIHELIHGIFFKLFNPAGKVKFGFKNGMAYATSPHSMYSKIKFSIIILAPFVFISLGLIAIYYAGFIAAIPFAIIAAIHGAGCVGDFYFMYLILRSPKEAFIEDTKQGINFYLKSDSDNSE